MKTSKEVMRCRELAEHTAGEITAGLGKLVTDIKNKIKRKGGEQIQTNTYILRFNQSHILKDMKTGYYFERVEQYIPAPLACFRCQKYNHHREGCRGRQICAKITEEDLDHIEDICLKKIKCPNSWQDHPAFSRHCDIYKREREILAQEKCDLCGSLKNSWVLYWR